MIERGKVDLVAATEEDAFTVEDSFGSEQGLNFAIALTSVDGYFEYELPPEMGNIVFTVQQWGYDEN